MRRIARSHPALWGTAFGLVFSLLGGTTILDVLGFWMGGLLILPLTGILGLSYATWRQRAALTTLWWAAGVVTGLLPVAAFLAGRTARFWLEFLLPLGTGLLVALTLGPLYIRWSRTRPRQQVTDAQAT